MLSRIKSILATARAGNWWSSKLPPLMAVAYATILRHDVAAGRAVTALVVALVSLSAVAWHAHVVNDLCDIDDDRRSGKTNRLASLGNPTRVALVAALPIVALTAALSPVVSSRIPAIVLGANMVVFALYSVPPVRLKAHRWWGVAADATGAHLLPTCFVLAVMPEGPHFSTGDLLFAIAALSWSLAAGVRGILVHQFIDREADRTAGLATIGTSASITWARSLILRRLLPIEAMALVAFAWMIVDVAPLILVAAAAYSLIEVVKVTRRWTLPLLDPKGVTVEPYRPLLDNSVYELWLPNVLALQIGAGGAGFAAIPVLQLALFVGVTSRRLHDLSRLAESRTTHQAPPYRRSVLVNTPPTRVPKVIASTEGDEPPIAIGATYWVVNGVNVFSANLARGLLKDGARPHVLLTESATDLISFHEPLMPRPADIPFVELPVKAWEPWGAHWGEMIRYLESMAPCIYIPNSDWRHSNVCPLLSDRVGVVGVVHSDDPLHYDHVLRLGTYWNAIVCVSRTLAERTKALLPHLADRIHTIPIGVSLPASEPVRPRETGHPLRVIYHGSLKVHQKRILDLPRIMQVLAAQGIPVVLTIAGGGPDEEQLRQQSESLMDSGHIRLLGVVPHDEIPGLLDEHDVYLLASEFEGMPNALIEAMGHGLVPVVTQIPSGPTELVQHGENGFLVPVGDVAGFAERLAELQADPDRRAQLAARAFASVRGSYSVQEMVADYNRLFRAVLDDVSGGGFRRPFGELANPPAEVAGVSLFPVALLHHAPGVGAFPTAWDYDAFKRRLQLTPNPLATPLADAVHGARARRQNELAGVGVIVLTPLWTRNGVNVHSENLVRGLGARGFNARLLVTEEDTDLVTVDAPRMRWPLDIPIDRLPVTRADGWGAHWGATVRYLEAHAPCIVLPTFDWRHACVLPQVGGEVYPIATVFPDDQSTMEQAARLADQWVALVARDGASAERIAAKLPALSDRIRVIPDGRWIPRARRVRNDVHGRFVDILICGGSAAPTSNQLRAVLEHLGSVRIRARLTAIGSADHPEAGVPAPGRLPMDTVEVTAWPVPDEFFDRAALILARLSSPHVPGELWKAMAWGCIPAVFDAGLGIAGMFRSGENCGLLADHDTAGMASFIQDVVEDSRIRDSLSVAAHHDAQRGAVSVDDMLDEYLALFADVVDEARTNRPRRPRGPMLPPPARIGDATVFPVDLPLQEDRVGRFTSADDLAAFIAARDSRPQ